MAKVNQPIEEFWESDKKLSYLEIFKEKIVRFIRRRNKNKKNAPNRPTKKLGKA